MSIIEERSPKKGEIWQHMKTGQTYVIVGLSFNAGTDRLEVLYVPRYECPYDFFTRPLFDHPKAFLGKDAIGRPRFQKVEAPANGEPHRSSA